MAQAKLGTLTLEFEAKIAKFTGAMEKVNERSKKVMEAFQAQAKENLELKKSAQESVKALQNQSTAMEKIQKTADNVSAKFGMVKTAIMGVVTGAAVKGFTNLTDSWVDLNSRMSLTVGADKAQMMMSALYENSKMTYTSLQATAEMFLGNSTALTELGYSYETQLSLTTALNNAFVISGAKGKDVESVMGAINNAFATGSLSGKDLNTVLAKGGRIADSLAKSFGVTTLELKTLAADGKLGVHEVVNAMLNDFDTLNNEADQLPTTVGDVFGRLKDAVLVAAGSFGEIINNTSALAGVFESAVNIVEKFNNSLRSGQFLTELKAITDGFFDSTDDMGKETDNWTKYAKEKFSEFSEFFLEAIKTMPMNFSIILNIVGQTLASFFLKTWEYMKYWGKRLMDPKSWFKGGGEMDIDLKVNLNAIDEASEGQFKKITTDWGKKVANYENAVRKGQKQLKDYEDKLKETQETVKGDDKLKTVGGKSFADMEAMVGGFSKAETALRKFEKIKAEIDKNDSLSAEEKAKLHAQNQKRYEEELASMEKSGTKAKKSAEKKIKANKDTSKSFEELLANYDKGQSLLNSYNKQMQDIAESSATTAQKQQLAALATKEFNKEMNKLKVVNPFQELLGGYDELQNAQNAHLLKIEDIKAAQISAAEQAELLRLETEKYNKEVNNIKGIKSFKEIMMNYDSRLQAEEKYKEVLEEIAKAEATEAEKNELRIKAQEEYYKATRSTWEQKRDELKDSLTAYDDMDMGALNNFTNAFSTAFSSIISGTQSVGDALRDMLSTLVQNTISAVSQMIAQWIALQAVQGALNAGGGNYGAGAGIFGNLLGKTPVKGLTSLVGMSHAGINEIPKTGTWLLEKGERVTTAQTSAKLDKTLDQILQNNTYNNSRSFSLNQNINIRGNVDNRTANQIALETDRKLKKADRRLG